MINIFIKLCALKQKSDKQIIKKNLFKLLYLYLVYLFYKTR